MEKLRKEPGVEIPDDFASLSKCFHTVSKCTLAMLSNLNGLSEKENRELFEVSDQFVGQHHPESILDEVGHFLAQEGRVLSRRVMAATLDAFIFLVVSPRLGGAFSRHSEVSP